MPGAGEYDMVFQLLVFSETKGATGGVVPAWTADGNDYWGAVEELSGTQRILAGVNTNGVNCRVRLRNFPTVTGNDRLRDKVTLDLYVLQSPPVNGDNEIIIDATRQRAELANRG